MDLEEQLINLRDSSDTNDEESNQITMELSQNNNNNKLYHIILPKPSQTQRFVNVNEYYIINGSAVNIECSDDISNNRSSRDGGIPATQFFCCKTRVHRISPGNRSASKRSTETYVRLHRVSSSPPGNYNPHNRLAYGDIVYIECGKGHVLRGTAITGKAKWNKSKTYEDEKVLKNTKCHFKIIGSFSDGNYLTSSRNFQLQSIHWPNCYVGGTRSNDGAVADSGSINLNALLIDKKSRLASKNAKVLNFFVWTAAVQPPRKISRSVNKRSVKCSHGYTKLAHRMACSSYLRQSSSSESSTSNYRGFSGPTDIDFIT